MPTLRCVAVVTAYGCKLEQGVQPDWRARQSQRGAAHDMSGCRTPERLAPMLHHPQQLVLRALLRAAVRGWFAEGPDVERERERHPALDLAQSPLAVLHSKLK